MAEVAHKPATARDIGALRSPVVGELLSGHLVIYPLYGVGQLWYLDPCLMGLEVLCRQNEDWLVTDTFFDRGMACAPPFDLQKLTLGPLWPFDPASQAQAQA